MASVPEMALHPWEVLLDRAGSDRVREEACDRDKGQTQANTVRRPEETETVCVEEKSISSAKAKKRGRKASRRDGHKQSYTSRRNVKLAEGRSGTGRRSAQELGITFPDAHCNISSNSSKLLKHYYVEVSPEIFRCEHCQEAIWQPRGFETAVAFGKEIHKYGLQKAYQRRVSRMPEVLDVLCELQAKV